MAAAPLYVQFTDQRSALQALDTLQELGYRSDLMELSPPGQKPTLRIFVEQEDLTSALEISQAHGGELLDAEAFRNESAIYTSAYGLDGLTIPAHIVNEDLPDSYMRGENSGPAAMAEEDMDVPSDEGYDHFPAGIRL